jgi:hypothetical protein
VDDVIARKTMGDIDFITGKEGGSLEKACQQVFDWTKDQKLIIVIWHSEWKDEVVFWRRIAETMASQTTKVSTLVVYFGDSLEAMKADEGGDRLPLLFRLLGRGSESRHGCCRITDFARLGGAIADFDPNAPETKLIIEGNRIMGLFPPSTNSKS